MDITHAYLQLTSVTQSYPIVWDHTDCSTSGSPVLHHLLELAQTHINQLADAIQPSNPLPSPSLPAINVPSTRVFSNESILCIKWPKYWNFSFSVSPSGLISFSIGWFDLLVAQGTLKSFLQHHSLKASILRCSAFLMVQFSRLYLHDYWKNQYSWLSSIFKNLNAFF